MPMRFEDPGPICLSGSLLLAVPAMQDENFRRGVVLLSRHTADEGAIGFVLNRPVGKRVSDLLKDPEFGALGDVPVFLGGPVSPEQLSFAALRWSGEPDGLHYSTHLSIDEAAREVEGGGASVRAFLGYSGWGEGQLEKEIQQHAWIVRKPENFVAREVNGEDLWLRLLKGMGPWYEILANEPEDPTLN